MTENKIQVIQLFMIPVRIRWKYREKTSSTALLEGPEIPEVDTNKRRFYHEPTLVAGILPDSSGSSAMRRLYQHCSLELIGRFIKLYHCKKMDNRPIRRTLDVTLDKYY